MPQISPSASPTDIALSPEALDDVPPEPVSTGQSGPFMQRAFRTRFEQLKAIELENQLLFTQLEAKRIATIEASSLHEIPHQPRSGSKPLLALEAGDGSRYALKLAEKPLMAAEVAAYELRCLARRPCIPTKLVRLELEGHGSVEGLLKPFIEFSPEELSTDTREWTDFQRHVMLMEHAWEWFLDNLDTNTTQFSLFNWCKFPLNIDWDRAFCESGEAELSRHAKYKGTLPNARTFLYGDYVEGRVNLHLSFLLIEARRIKRLPKPLVKRSLEKFAKARFEEPGEQRAFVLQVMKRQHQIERLCLRFTNELARERAAFLRAQRSPAGATRVSERLQALRTSSWNQCQVVIHEVFQGPFGKAGRWVLTRLRSPARQAK